jgi:integrase
MAVKKGEEVWPRVVKNGFVSVRVYRVKSNTNASGFAYTLSFTEGGKRRLQKFADPDKAIAEAKHRAELLASGMRYGATMSVDDAEILKTAKEICGSIPVTVALREWKAARDYCGDSMVAVCEASAAQKKELSESVKVSVAIERFKAQKEAAGRKVRKTYKPLDHLALPPIGPMTISQVTADDLREWMAERYKHPVYYNTAHKRFRALWRWARKQSLLPKSGELAPDLLERRTEIAERIGIINSTQLRSILRETHSTAPKYLAAVVVAALCGLRSDEVAKQLWADVDLARSLLTVTGAKLNTPAYRKVKLCKAAVEWLKLCPRPEDGRLVDTIVAVERTRDVARAIGIDVPPNAYRHSYISHAIELKGDVGSVAIQSGNSPEIIISNYRELVDPKEARRWFESGPRVVLA